MTFNLNRIKDLDDREKHARYLKKKLNKSLLPAGFPFEDLESNEMELTMEEGIDVALKIKLQSGRNNTRKTYKRKSSLLSNWGRKDGLRKWPLHRFRIKVARRLKIRQL